MKEPLLLDTCAALRILGNEKIRKEAEDAINATLVSGEAIRVSPITAWEVGMLAAKGRFKSIYAPQKWFERLLGVPGVQLAEMPAEMLLQSSFLPGELHWDPADRIIAATAREFGLRVVTSDRALLAYGMAGHMLTLAC
ncbi:MAG: PIN domain-containing protein [Alphaproteobacteria bacterium]|nr:PIN domain-containing protein [Alphaproteobacteria bacterium]